MRRLLLIALLIPAAATAQEQAEEDQLLPEQTEREVRYKDETNIDFDVIDVKGQVQGPQIIDVWTRAESKGFPPLFQLRASWDQEMVESLDEVK